MKRFAIAKLVSSVAIASSVMAGGLGFSAPAFAADGQAGAAAADGGAHEHGHRHHRGHADLVRAALQLPSLRADQKAKIEAIEADRKQAHAGVRAAKADLLDALAGQVQQGKVDEAAVKPKTDAVARAMTQAAPVERASLEKLHAVLDPAQRAELVEQVEAHREHGPQEAGERGARGAKGHGEHFGKDLNLTPEQKAQIRDAMKAERQADRQNVPQDRMREHHEEQRRVMEAFKGDRFVMNELAPPPDAAGASRAASRIVKASEVTTPVLTPAQRATAAAKMREHAAKERAGTR